MFGINGGELIVLLVVALVIVGPERLPHYAEQLAQLVKSVRRFAKGAQAQMREELGPEFDDIDWQKLDPRQYDPRRIVRDALSDVWDDDPAPKKNSGAHAASAPRATPPRASAATGVDLQKKGAAAPAAAPYDEDAT
ncbi:twin-arginine translocase TatA/TatE family subunit [Paenibacillus sp. TRM 82003]|uniref:twin-arginine translocase TatA/TatE family subunit n=1 Tax=Kineococcus sp. TRM81007 TaxID=2925831 RepID=UPI001F582C7C|nr:twin-arginine translocase TatA/TatE family subunit [Kineococcus sp. TRM81007]MCI2239183.1 twin-arginine translocase TatA/TatE family subunit [Kineococcus sp. TRM81007]MCI3924862.1 twin-arginine translocase TatA/TatE family subunit [Paenibacillus sp. TRM 82003]